MNVPDSLWRNILEMDFSWNEDGKVWFIGLRLQYIFCADINKKEIDIVLKLPNESVLGYRKYQQLIKYKDKLICLPCFNKDILIYDMVSGNVNNVLIKNCQKFSEMCCICVGTVKCRLYIVAGWNVKKIIVLDMEEEKILDIFDVECSDNNDMIGTSSVMYRRKIYMPIWNKEKIVSFDVETYEFEEHFISGDICGCACIYQDGKNCWIIGRNYGILKWNPDTGVANEVKDIPVGFKVFAVGPIDREVEWYEYGEKRIYDPLDKNYFCRECLFGEIYMWVIPAFSNSIIRIDTETMKVRVFQFESEYRQEYSQDEELYEFSMWGVGSDGNLRIITRQNCNIYCINTRKMSGLLEKWDLSENALNRILFDLFDSEIYEKRGFQLDTFLFGAERGYLKEKDVKKGAGIGVQIYCESS